MNRNNCQCQTSKESQFVDACSSCVYWWLIVPIIITGVLAFVDDERISEKTKNESFIAFWVFMSIVFLLVTILIVALIINMCFCLGIPNICTSCFKKNNEKNITQNANTINIENPPMNV